MHQAIRKSNKILPKLLIYNDNQSHWRKFLM